MSGAGIRGGRALVAAAVLALLAVACSPARPEAVGPTLVLGVGSTGEQRLLAALTVVALDRQGVNVDVRGDLGGTVGLRRQAARDTIDLFWDYTGAAWSLGLGQEFPPADPEESFQRVAQADLENGLVWLGPTAANATLALFVREEDFPPEGQPRGMSRWLATVLSSGGVRLCADPDFLARPQGLGALAEVYFIDLNRLGLVSAAEEQAIERAAAGDCFAALATATSGAARNAGLVRVPDDLPVPVFPPAFVVAPVARAAVLDELDLATHLEPVVGRLDTETLGRLNAAVEGGASPGEVAEEFLADVAPSTPADTTGGTSPDAPAP
jgi:osmoprotectant transport system substrate-binding protein